MCLYVNLFAMKRTNKTNQSEIKFTEINRKVKQICLHQTRECREAQIK